MKQLDLTEARAKLSPTLKHIDRGPVAIKVRGEVAAYLVSKTEYESLVQRRQIGKRRFDVAGSMAILAEGDTLSASDATLKLAGEQWDRQNS